MVLNLLELLQNMNYEKRNYHDDYKKSCLKNLSIIVANGQEPLRIDKFLMNRIEGATRNKIQQAIEAERVLVNDKPVKSNYKVRPHDKIVIYETIFLKAMKLFRKIFHLKLCMKMKI